jgi:hypothetical protein
MAVKGHSATYEIMTRAIPAYEASRADGRLGICTERLEVGLDETIAGLRIIVEQHQYLATSRTHTEMDPTCKAEVVLGSHHIRPWITYSGQITATVGGAVVHHDHLDVGVVSVPDQ